MDKEIQSRQLIRRVVIYCVCYFAKRTVVQSEPN